MLLSHRQSNWPLPQASTDALGRVCSVEVRFPFLHDWFQLSEYIIAGESHRPVSIDTDTSIGVLICYEDIVPEMSRLTVQMERKHLFASSTLLLLKIQ